MAMFDLQNGVHIRLEHVSLVSGIYRDARVNPNSPRLKIVLHGHEHVVMFAAQEAADGLRKALLEALQKV